MWAAAVRERKELRGWENWLVVDKTGKNICNGGEKERMETKVEVGRQKGKTARQRETETGRNGLSYLPPWTPWSTSTPRVSLQ